MARRLKSLPREVFLSHSSRNRGFVKRLAGNLRRHGIGVWYSEKHIVGAQQWHDQIGASLRRCDWFLLVLSPHSVKSRWVKHELLYAISNSRYDGRIVPVLYRPCDTSLLSWTLQALQHVDFTGKPEAGYRELFRTWGIAYQALA